MVVDISAVQTIYIDETADKTPIVVLQMELKRIGLLIDSVYDKDEALIEALQWADVLNTTINISKSAEKKYGSSSGDYMSSPDIKIEVTCGKDFQQRLVVIKKNILAVYETSKVVKFF